MNMIPANKKGANVAGPKYRRIAIVDDDEESRQQWLELIQGEYPMLEVNAYESIASCWQGLRIFDFLIIDISSVAPNMMNDVAHAYRPIAHFLESYPHTQIIIQSAMARSSTHEVVDDIRRAVPEAKVHYGGHGQWEPLKRKLHELIKEGDTDWRTPLLDK